MKAAWHPDGRRCIVLAGAVVALAVNAGATSICGHVLDENGEGVARGNSESQECERPS